MPLTPDQEQKFEDYLKTKNVKPACPACGTANLIFADILSLPFRQHSPGGVSEVHMVPVVCGECAHVRLFLAGPVGLIPDRGR